MRVNVFETDVLIIGGGMTAARAAIAAADAGVDVVVVSKTPLGKSGASAMAEGNIAAALAIEDSTDSPDAHYRDMLAVGRGLTDPELARANVDEAPERIRDMVNYGVPFRRRGDRLAQGQPPGHSHPRSFGAGSGVAIMNPLRRKMLSYPNVHLYDDTLAMRLFTDGGKVSGALCLDIADGELLACAAGATIIATGGYQEIFPLSTASTDLTGDGFALASEAGAELVDMEILLFYPTALLTPASVKGTMILYEFFLHKTGGAGAHLVNVDGDDLLASYDRLPVRDELARRIFDEIQRGKATEGGGVFVDVSRSDTPIPERRQVVKGVAAYERLTEVGFNVAESKFEVGPAAHTTLGGIRINSRCETNIPGLYAAGEAAGNVHGANRLGANALTDTQVFGFRAGQAAAGFARESGRPRLSDKQIADAARPVVTIGAPKAEPKDVLEVKSLVQQTMFQHVGPTRSEESTTAALHTMENVLRKDVPRLYVPTAQTFYNYPLVEALEATYMAQSAMLVCYAARLRRESRGHHYRSDYPTADDSRPPQHTLVSLRNGEIVGKLYPVT